jgi:hypothetical protein
MKLSAKSFGLTCGILWGLCVALMTVLNLIPAFNGYAGEMLLMVRGFYPGYDISWLGVLVGAVYGFIDGFVGGWLLAWLYNRLAKN